MHPSLKHWVKRPLHDQLVEYAVGGVNPLWDLGTRMMRSVGEAGVAGTIRMSKQSIQYFFDDAHKSPPDEEKRYTRVACILLAMLGTASSPKRISPHGTANSILSSLILFA